MKNLLTMVFVTISTLSLLAFVASLLMGCEEEHSQYDDTDLNGLTARARATCPNIDITGYRDMREVTARCVDDLTIRDTDISTISLPTVERIRGDLTIVGNAELIVLSFPALEVVRGRILMTFNPRLYNCHAIQTVLLIDDYGSVTIRNNINDECGCW